MTATVFIEEGQGENNTIFVDWFWQVAWLLPDYSLVMLPTLSFETACKRLDEDFEGEYVDYIIPGEEDAGEIMVHKGDRFPLH